MKTTYTAVASFQIAKELRCEMRLLKINLIIVCSILAGCSTSDQFKTYVQNNQCSIHNFAALANPINANGSVDESVAAAGCDDSLSVLERGLVRQCEAKSGRKCLITMTYSRRSDQFQNLQQKNIADARRRQAEQYYENLKDKCVLIGYAKGTAQNSDCVMKLVQNAEQIQLQQDLINQQQQDNRYWQLLQGSQILNQPDPVPSQTTCNKVGQYINCTTR